MSTHTLSVLVENKPGVLAHVAGLFSRRAFNISSLSVGPTADPKVSRMTIVVDGASTPVDQVHKQLEKLRAELVDLATSYRANVVDLGSDTIVLEAVCSPGRLDQLLEELAAHGTCELVRTGLIAISRGSETITDDMELPQLAAVS